MTVRDHRVPAALATYHAEVIALRAVDAAPEVWRRHRAAIAVLTREVRQAAWDTLCARVHDLGTFADEWTAKVWLKRSIAIADAQDGRARHD